MNIGNKRTTCAMEYLDTVINTGEFYSEEDLAAVNITPASRCIVNRIYGSGSVYRVPNGITLSQSQSRRTFGKNVKLGLVIVKASVKYPELACDMAAKIAQFLLYSDFVPSEVTMVCCDAHVVKQMDKNELSKNCITVYYDDSGASGITPQFSDELAIDYRGHIIWHGNIPKAICNYQRDTTTKAIRESVVSELRNIMSGLVAPMKTSDENMMFSMAHEEKELTLLTSTAAAISFGYVDLKYLTQGTQMNIPFYGMRSGSQEFVDWMLENVIFTNKEQLKEHSVSLPAPDYNEIRDVAQIWKYRLRDYTVSLGTGTYLDVDGVQEFGRLIGVDSMVSAYYSGVPVEDILI